MGRAITLRAYAKINWSLEVGVKRTDGFHDVRTILQTIALSDTIRIVPTRGPLTVDCHAADVPSGQANLAWRAASVLWRALKRTGEPHGAKITITKKIPVGAGLGGGSSDAAATLVALNALWGANWRRSQLIQLAGDIGSDVPFFLVGGTALALGRGEEILPLQDVRPQSLVVIKPALSVATAEAYGWLDADRGGDAVGVYVTTSDEVEGLGWPHLDLGVRNDLQAPVAHRHRVIQDMIDAAYEAGARVSSMSGSGSAVFAVFSRSAIRTAVRRLTRPDWQCFASETLPRSRAGRFEGL